jgi:hypothetical protein
MVFITVPEERFKTDVLKTRISFLKNDEELSGVTVLSRRPDVDIWLKLPNIVISRVWKEDWELARLSGYHWESKRVATDSPEEVWQLKGYTMTAMRQFDIMTKTIWEMNKIASIVERKLKSNDKSDIFANDWAGLPQTTVIPILDFADATSGEGSPTDLAIRFRPQRDVECVEIPAFDSELHQYAITISFWVHYLKEYEFPKIISIQTNTEIEITN